MSLFQRVVNKPRWSHSGSYGFPLQSLLQWFQCSREDEYVSYGEVGMPVPPFGCSFSSVPDMPHVLAVTNEEGIVRLYDTECGDMQQKIVKDWQAHTNAVFDVAWVPGEHKLVTASGDQTAKLFDVKAGELLGECKGHQCSLKSVTFSKFEKAVFSTGGRDGNIMVWDTRCNKKDGFYRHVNQISGAHNAQDKQTPLKIKKRKPASRGLAPSVDSQQSVTVVVFQDEHTLISAGAVDGVIKMWDLRKNYTAYRQDPVPAKSLPYPGSSTRKLGYSSLILDTTGTSLFASCTDDNIYMFNVAGLKSDPVSVFSGHHNSTFYIKSSLSPDGQFLLSGSSDHSAYIWQVSNPYAPPIMLQGHSQEVTSVTWSPTDFTKLVTCSDDNTVRVWRLKRGGSKGAEEDTMNRVGWSCPKKVESPSTSTVQCTPAKSPIVQTLQFMSSPTPATCAPSYTGDLPMSSSTPTSPFMLVPKLHTPKRQKTQTSTTSPRQESASKVTIKNWVTRTPKSLTPTAKTPSPRKALTPIEQYPAASDSRAPPTYEKRVKRRLETSSEDTEHECFTRCNCVTELEPGVKKTKMDLELCSGENEDIADTRCLTLADLGKDTVDRSASKLSIDVSDGPVISPTLVKSATQNKENSTPEKNWLSALGSKMKSDKSSTHCKVTNSPPSSSGSAKKTPARSIANSPISASTPGSSKKISMYFQKRPTE